MPNHAGFTVGAAAAQPEPEPEDDGAELDRQGSRFAGGLNHTAPLNSLAARFRPLVGRDLVDFLDAIKPIEEAAIIPYVMRFAETTLANARDAKEFGALKDDPLDVQGIAHIMKYSAEDTDPTFYGDMNNKCYVPDRAKIDPCKRRILSSSRLYCGVSLT